MAMEMVVAMAKVKIIFNMKYIFNVMAYLFVIIVGFSWIFLLHIAYALWKFDINPKMNYRINGIYSYDIRVSERYKRFYHLLISKD